eukprot:4747569-Pyramimonas_sp.AAC.1
MPTKGAPKAKAKAGSGGSGGGPSSVTTTPTAGHRADNASYYQTLHNDVKTVVEHVPDFKSMAPLGLAEGGSTVGFKLETMMSMYSNTG